MQVRRVFLGAQLLGDADRRRAAVAELSGLTDTDIAARLAHGRRLHGPRGARRPARRARRRRLPARLHVGPPLLPRRARTPTGHEAGGTGHRRRRRRRPEHGRLRAGGTASGGCWPTRSTCTQLADGGHYFLRTRPAQAAEAVLQAAALSPSFRSPDRPTDHRRPERTSTCRPHSPAPRSRWSGRPASRRCCASPPRVTRPVGPSRTATRCAPRCARTASVLVRGLGLRDAAAVGAVFRGLAGTGLMAERESFAPRQALGGGVYSSTKWPPTSRCACTTS